MVRSIKYHHYPASNPPINNAYIIDQTINETIIRKTYFE